MKIKFYIQTVIFFLIPVLLTGAEWDSLNVRVLDSRNSDEQGSTRYRLADDKDRIFEVNYQVPPEESTRNRVIELKDLFYAWNNIKTNRVEFYFSTEGTYVNLHTQQIAFDDLNLLPYLPAGLAFQDKKNGLYYRFRIVVKDVSYMIEGLYTGEEALLKKIYGFIKTKENEKPEEIMEKRILHRVSISALGYYLIPTGKMSTIFQDGYGFTTGITLHDAGISLNDKTLFHLDFTLSAGYWCYGIESPDVEETSCAINSAYIIPLTLSARAPFKFYRNFFIAPAAGFGMNYNSIDYIKPVAGAEDNPVALKQWAPSLFAGVQLGYTIIEDKLALIAGSQFNAMFEKYMTSTSYSFYAGAEYSFMILGD